MRVKSVQIKNIKGFSDSDIIEFSPKINVLIGHNNAGKSTISKSVCVLQNFSSMGLDDIRMGTDSGQIEVAIENIDTTILKTQQINSGNTGHIKILFSKKEGQITTEFESSAVNHSFSQFSTVEPNNFIYPYLSKRKVLGMEQQLNLDRTSAVTGNFQNLHAKISRLSTTEYPAHTEYVEICKKILDFVVTSSASKAGVQGGLIVNNYENIPIENMGEGVPNILGLIVDLCVAKNKLFIIEEPENDLHPKAIKNLFEFIIQKSEYNQFIITTHSNIVTKYLGSEPESKLFHVTSEIVDNIPTSSVRPVGRSAEERISVLEDLGYEFFDYDLWQAYLILEESSAERIIRDFLIPEFVSNLKYKLKTIASQGISDVKPRFNDFQRLFVFIHTAPAYKDRAWVLVDGDTEGQHVINELKDKFKSWGNDHFKYLSKSDFEEFYPDRFKEDVSKALVIPDKAKKRKAKEDLLNQVLVWINSNKETAKSEFKESASEVISFLSSIDKALGE